MDKISIAKEVIHDYEKEKLKRKIYGLLNTGFEYRNFENSPGGTFLIWKNNGYASISLSQVTEKSENEIVEYLKAQRTKTKHSFMNKLKALIKTT